MPSDRRDRNDDFKFDERPIRRRRDDADERDDYADAPRRRPGGKGLNVPGLIGMILGIVGLLVSLFPCIGWIIGGPLAAIGLILSIVGLCTTGQTTGRGFPIAGLIISLAALLVGGGWFLFARHMTNKAQEKLEAQKVEWEKQIKAAEEQARADREKLQNADRELRDGKAITVTAAQLYDDYRKNVLDADRKYRGKVVDVSGPVHRVDKDRFGRLAVELDAGGDGLVRCDFPREADAQLAALKPDQKVLIRGRCVGNSGRDVVKLETCVLVTREK
jgi:hypothetical protein